MLHQTFNIHSLLTPNLGAGVRLVMQNGKRRLRRVSNRPDRAARKQLSRDAKPDLPTLLTIKGHPSVAFEETRTSLNPSWEVGLASQALKRATWPVSYGGAGTTGLRSVGRRPTGECSSRRPASVPQDPAALTVGCTLGRGPHCPFPLGLLDQGCCGLRTKGLPLTQQTVDGAHRAPR